MRAQSAGLEIWEDHFIALLLLGNDDDDDDDTEQRNGKNRVFYAFLQVYSTTYTFFVRQRADSFFIKTQEV